MRGSLSTRIVGVVALVSIIPLTLVGILSYRTGTAGLQDSAVAEMLALTAEREAAMDLWFQSHLSRVRTMSVTDDLPQKADTLVASSPGTRAARSARAILLSELLPHVSGSTHDYSELFVMEPGQGRVLVSTDPGQEGKLKAGHPYFDRGKAGLYLQPPYRSPDADAEVITIAAPLRSASGQLVAVLAARARIADLVDLLQRRTGLRQSEDAFLIDADGRAVTQPRFIADTAALARVLDTEAVRRCAAGGSGVVLAPDYRGVPAIAVYRWNARYRLGLIVKIDQAEALAPGREFGRRVALISGLALVGTVFCAWLMARTITQPLNHLTGEVRRFVPAGGDGSRPQGVGDEVALLGREFEFMAQRVTDRTAELARANAALLEAKDFSDQLILSQPGTFGLIEPGGRYLRWNARLQALLGLSNAEMARANSLDVFEPAERARAEEKLAEALRDGFSTNETRVTVRGAFAFYRFLAARVDTQDGPRLIVTGADITRRRAAEESLQQANRELGILSERHQVAAAVIANSSEGVMVTDAQLQIESVNPAFEKITGYSAAEVVGHTPKILFSGRHDDAFFHGLHEQVDAEGRWRGEIWNRGKDGRIYPQETSINILRDADGHIRHYASVFSDNTVQHAVEVRLRELSALDGLTGIANRRTFDETLSREWARASREGRPLSLLMIDIDFFKKYNDRYGHLEGDRCLRQVTQAIRQAATRASDLAARYGGEEFAVILPGADAASAAAMGEKIRAGVAALALPHADSSAAPVVTLSVGIASVIPQRSSSPLDLIGAADGALYRAKRAGRNRVTSATEALPA